MWLWFGCGRLDRKVRHLEEKVEELAHGVDEVASGVVSNQELRRFLEFKVGREIVVYTPSAEVRGVLLCVGSGVLQLRETAGARTIIPFSKVTYIQ